MSKQLVCDNHCYLTPHPGGDAIEQLYRHKRSGFDIVFLNLGDAATPLDHIIRMAAFYRNWIAAHEEDFALISRVSDIGDVAAAGKLAVAFNIEGSICIGDQLDMIALFYDIGVRWIALVYNKRNQVGSGCHDHVDEGLTEFGRHLVTEMDRVGMIKCCSHAGFRTAREIMEMSNLPTVFTHSNPAAVKKHARNIPDDLVKACAETGGIIGINGIGIFLGKNEARADLMVQHIDYVVQLVGVDHVGLGFDYGYSSSNAPQMDLSDTSYWPPGNEYDQVINCVPPEALDDIRSGLEKRGYGESDIAKICGGNFMRVAEIVWK